MEGVTEVIVVKVFYMTPEVVIAVTAFGGGGGSGCEDSI